MFFWRRRWVLILLLFIGTLALGLLSVFWGRWRAEDELRQTLADLDAAEPDWRLEQLEAKRRVLPDERNGAVFAMKVYRALPKNWQSKVQVELDSTPPAVRLPPEVARQLAEDLDGVAKVVVEARKLIDYPHGRHAIKYAPDFLSTLVVDQQNTRGVANLLFLDAHRSIEDAAPSQAWRSILALLHAGRTFEDEPFLITQLVRMAFQELAVRGVERVLAHGALSPMELESMQQALAEEARAELFLIGMRGERAGMHQCMQEVMHGPQPITAAVQNLGLARKNNDAAWWDHLTGFLAMRMALRSNTWLLRHHTEVIEAAQQPPAERYERLEAVELAMLDTFSKRDYDLILARLLAPATSKVADAERRLDSRLHCAVVALAAEHYRLRHQQWPDHLDDLVRDKLLAEAPMDLYAAKPVRLRRAPDGVVIYSIGKDGLNQGDALDRFEEFDPNRIRIEFRLWDPPHRRQPPLPPRKPVEREPAEPEEA